MKKQLFIFAMWSFVLWSLWWIFVYQHKNNNNITDIKNSISYLNDKSNDRFSHLVRQQNELDIYLKQMENQDQIKKDTPLIKESLEWSADDVMDIRWISYRCYEIKFFDWMASYIGYYAFKWKVLMKLDNCD